VVDEPELTLLSQLTPVISTTGFRRHLELIRSSGYAVVSMPDALRLIERGEGRRGQYVCLTFDDGRLDNRINAWPILREFGFSAHFFVSSGLVGTSQPGAASGLLDRYMSALDLRTIIAEGASVGSHGRSHRDLTTLDAGTLDEELAGSRAVLERLLGVPVLSYAYAYSCYNRRVLAATRSAGYRHGFAINAGSASSTDRDQGLTIPRNVIRSGPSEPENIAVIQGGLDFVRPYSNLKRRIRYGV